METASEHAEPLVHAPTAPTLDAPRTLARRARDRAAAAIYSARFAIGVYLATRALLLLVAFVNGTLRHHAFTHELSQWDGLWYRMLADHGDPTHVSHVQTTLGFFPVYPGIVWAVSHVFVVPIAHWEILSSTIAGVIVAGIGGLVATVLVQRLATGWWGEHAGRKAVLIFCLFPGSAVFSMVYAEGVLLVLAAGCILALQKRRWVLPARSPRSPPRPSRRRSCLWSCAPCRRCSELRRRGFGDCSARRSLFAPALSLVGVGAFAGFLWAWTSAPPSRASSRSGTGGARRPTRSRSSISPRSPPPRSHSVTSMTSIIYLDLVAGLVGAVILILLLVLVLCNWREMSVEAIVWTLGISWLAMTSEYTPPKPRLVITAFPAVIVLARYVHGKWWTALLWANGVALVGLSALTFVGTTLRP